MDIAIFDRAIFSLMASPMSSSRHIYLKSNSEDILFRVNINNSI